MFSTIIKSLLIAAMLFVPVTAQAACNEVGCWQIEVLAFWTQSTINGTTRNHISVNETYPGKCVVMRDLTNVGHTILDGVINAEIFECWYNDATKDLIDADSNYLIVTGSQLQEGTGWMNTLRPKSEAITSPEFSYVRNWMTARGWNTNGADSCIGKNKAGRTRGEILETLLGCIGDL
jgi:hypothetical protein